MRNSDDLTKTITYHQAREIVLAMIRVALFDLESSDPLKKNAARDWLIDAGLSLAEEVQAGVSTARMASYIHESVNGTRPQRKKRRFHRNAYGNHANV